MVDPISSYIGLFVVRGVAVDQALNLYYLLYVKLYLYMRSCVQRVPLNLQQIKRGNNNNLNDNTFKR